MSKSGHTRAVGEGTVTTGWAPAHVKCSSKSEISRQSGNCWRPQNGSRPTVHKPLDHYITITALLINNWMIISFRHGHIRGVQGFINEF